VNRRRPVRQWMRTVRLMKGKRYWSQSGDDGSLCRRRQSGRNGAEPYSLIMIGGLLIPYP